MIGVTEANLTEEEKIPQAYQDSAGLESYRQPAQLMAPNRLNEDIEEEEEKSF